ncbi:MAG TPA: ATP-binding protein, partial [Pseudonocardia sp.]|nr:ATP-binding protein [Pseudonocardia sp.]
MARSALFSPSVLSSAASGHRLPTLRVALAFVASCDGDAQLWERRWRAVSGAVEPPAERTREVSAEAERRARRVVGRPADVSPAQLPLRPRGFAGHAVERARLVAEGGVATRPLVVSGPVGVGKTDLALRYAHDMAVAMPDGQLYADLGTAAAQGGSPEAVVRAFLRALGVTDDQVPEAPWQQAGLYRSLLARRRLVVLLDGVRDEQQVRPLLGETSGSLLILISRRLLLGLSGVRRIQLGVLPRHESVAMLRALAGTQADADPEACDRLAELCGDLPLALDVAGRRLAARPDRFPRDVVEHAARRGGLLEWLRVGD